MRRGSSSRGARGAPTSSRGSSTRGRGRGAIGSSSKFRLLPSPAECQQMRAEHERFVRNQVLRREDGLRTSMMRRRLDEKLTGNLGPAPKADSDNSFERERLENASIREQKGQLRGTNNVRGTGRGAKTVRFEEPLAQFNEPNNATPAAWNPFAQTANTSPFGTPSVPSASAQNSNPFARPTNPFAPLHSTPPPGNGSQNVFNSPSSNPFNFANPINNARFTALSNIPDGPNQQSNNLGSLPGSSSQPQNQIASKLAMEIDLLLRKNGIIAPSWPTSNPGDPSQKATVENFWQTTKAYRAKVRTCLIRNGFLDDPDKPKRLSEAIDFKGTCEGMCPEFEKITRIMEHDVQNPEKEFAPDGHTLWPSLSKMVKALARSAAGQDAPLPDDVRSPAALKRTLDYLINDVLGENELSAVHGFLWDRTRAIRRDFVFQQSSLSPDELQDQVYCLEHITRFHVIALHQMSRKDVATEDFSEQQEVEQLGKALLSLIHSYEDCEAQNIQCENEAEFRAYYVLFNVHNTAILEAVQDWGWKFWGKSDDVKTAVNLAESLNNIWDMRGPLNPQSPSDVAPNLFRRFFSILEDTKVSYTMACFAEIHFNKVRKAALKTILASYRKQRDQTRDWTLSKMNMYLQFDDEQDIVAFGEAYGLHFQEFEGEEFLSFESDDSMVEPFPQLKQYHSYNFVERKRGDFTFQDAISRTVYEEEAGDDDEGMFVPEESPWELQQTAPAAQPPSRQISSPGPHKAVPDANTLPRKVKSPAAVSNLLENTTKVDLDQTSKSDFSSHVAPPTVGNISQRATESSATEPIAKTVADTATSTLRPQTSSAGIFSFLSQNQNTNTATGSSVLKPLPSAYAPKPDSNQNNTAVSQDSSQAAIAPAKSLGSSNTSSLAFPKAQSLADLGSGVATLQRTEPDDILKGVSVPSPSSLGGFQITKAADLPAPTVAAPASQVAAPQPFGIPEFAKWIAFGDGGVLDQFSEMLVHTVLLQVVDKFTKEEQIRVKEEEIRIKNEQLKIKEDYDRKLMEEASQFRVRSLATKYVYLWRKNAHLMWMRRKGKRARELRKQMAQEARISAMAQKKDIVEEFRVSTQKSGRKSLEDMLSATGVLNGVHEPEAKVKSVVRRDESKEVRAVSKSPAQSHTPSPRVAKVTNNPSHRRGQSESPIRRTTFINDLKGGSRIHLLPNWNPETERLLRLPQRNAVRTDYFRLKARGIVTLPDGSTMADPTAVNLLYEKKSLEEAKEANKTDSPPLPPAKPFSWSTRSKFVGSDAPSTETPEQIEALKARARDIMAAEKEEKERQRKKRRAHDDDDDEALFAQAKRIREQMAEGLAWYKSEREKETVSRSPSGGKRSI